MQKSEVVIEQFVKTIKESSLDVQGDPVLLNRIFEAMEKKKKRKKIFFGFLFLSVVIISLSFVIWDFYTPQNELKQSKGIVNSPKHLAQNYIKYDVAVLNIADENATPLPVKKASTTINKGTSRNVEDNFTNVVSYQFNNHHVDVFKNGEEEFIQINVFGADGVEQDVLKIMEDLKKSYKNNEVYVDSVKHK